MAKKSTFETYKTTAEIPVPERIIDQVIGQEEGVKIVEKAASQKRNVFLVGSPGTGKSMLGLALAELLPTGKLVDIMCIENTADPNHPKIKTVPAGRAKKIIEKQREEIQATSSNIQLLSFVLPILMFLGIMAFYSLGWIHVNIAAAFIVVSGLVFAASVLTINIRPKSKDNMPKILVDNEGKKMAPFEDGTGALAGSLLGDVRHDPFQSGGLGTPPHMRVEAGMIHKANKGVLFIDEVATLSMKSQQELLTAMQEKKYAISGKSEMSSGAMVRSHPVPCDFVLVAAGNLIDLQKMHPALRSRIRGYGYEVYLNEFMDDVEKNRKKMIQFIAQEVKKDGKIPHFDRGAVEEVIKESKRRAGRKGKLTMQLRALGGLIRAAGDVALTKKAPVVTEEHVKEARKLSRTLEEQIADKYISMRKEYEVFKTTGYEVGRINGLAVMGDGGMVIPIVAEVAPAMSKTEGKTIATGKLGKIAAEAVMNVNALVKKHTKKDLSAFDTHIQFIQTYEGVEGDSASISVAAAVISALEDVPADQGTAMTGSLSVRGEVLPVGGVSQKVEAAYEAGIRKILIPKANVEDLVLSKETKKNVEILPVSTISDVLKQILKPGKKKQRLLNEFKQV